MGMCVTFMREVVKQENSGETRVIGRVKGRISRKDMNGPRERLKRWKDGRDGKRGKKEKKTMSIICRYNLKRKPESNRVQKAWREPVYMRVCVCAFIKKSKKEFFFRVFCL